MVFVLDRKKRPLMPCTPKRARLLLTRGRAVVHRLHPFTIRLKDRLAEDSTLQPVSEKLDPGSTATGVAIVREEQTPDGPVHHASHLAEIVHRGAQVHRQITRRAYYRRRRRSANLRYRSPRFANRRRTDGWLSPCLRSRVGNVVNITRRYTRLAPIVRVDLELNKFDTQKLEDPEIQNVEYRQGTLFGYEVRAYLLEKWGRRCAYCKAEGVPLQVEHIVPRGRQGSDRISNLALACRRCNEAKGTRTAAEFGHPEVQARAAAPLRDAAALNATRWAIYRGLQNSGFTVSPWTGGHTKWNRTRFSLPKSHVLDALCVGDVAGVSCAGVPVLVTTATGRGQRRRTNVNASGFPRGYLKRTKRIHGFQTGDLVRADVPSGRYAGTYFGRVVVRAKGSFCLGSIDSISWRYCRLLWRADGYAYQTRKRGTLSSLGLQAGVRGEDKG